MFLKIIDSFFVDIKIKIKASFVTAEEPKVGDNITSIDIKICISIFVEKCL